MAHEQDENKVPEALVSNEITTLTAAVKDESGTAILTGGRVMQIVKEAEKSNTLSKDFFDLQIQFAIHAQRITGLELGDVLLRYTCLYRRFSLPTPPDAQNPEWKHFVAQIKSSESLGELAYNYYLGTIKKGPETPLPCFSYHYEWPGTICLHFANNDKSEKGPLSDEQMPERIAELRGIFTEVKKWYPEATTVKSPPSWIHAMPKMLRLFPSGPTQNLEPVNNVLDATSTWGQFLNRKKEVRKDVAQAFLEKIQKAKTEDELMASFPSQAFTGQCDIDVMYKFFGVA